MNEKARIDRLIKRASAGGFEAGVILDSSSIYYLTASQSGGVLFVDSERSILFSPPVNFTQALETSSEAVECRRFKGGWPEELKEFIGRRRFFFEAELLSCENFSKLTSLGGEQAGFVSEMRSVKEPGEIELIRRACRKAAEIVESVEPGRWMGKTEAELAGYLQMKAWQDGFSGCSFTPVVASGKNSARPHHMPSDDIIGFGWLKIDYGIRYKGYCSDLTRTLILSKFVSNFDSENLLGILGEAKAAGEKKLRPGAVCSDIDSAVRGVLKRYGFEKYFTHGLGHGVGLDVHEGPRLVPESRTVLKESMVVTVEPGIYIRGAGGMRLEDTYLITSEGSEQLTRQSP